MTHRRKLALSAPALLIALLAACESKAPEPTAASADLRTTAAPVNTTPKPARTSRPPPPKPVKKKISAIPVAEVKPSDDDPIKGKWTLADATKGLPKSEAKSEPKGDDLVASIETDLGTLECTLFADKAPITVANFVGLARGTRPWKTPEGKWEKKPAYDGTIFHRIIKGFMIQGGDAKKNGSGEAGFVIPDEVWEDANHDRAGLLCMANRGKNTNSAQFFITDDAAYHLDNGYTIFGECGPVELVHKIASVEIEKGDKPKSPPLIKKVTVTRKKASAPATSGSAAAGPAPSASAVAGPAATGSAKAGSLPQP